MFSHENYVAAAEKIGCEPEVIEAVVQKEIGNSNPFFTSGGKQRLKILFERHVFWRELVDIRRDPREILRGDPALSDILNQQPYSKYGSFSTQYDRRDQAAAIHRDAALASCSYSAFQIMGNNFKAAGFESVTQFVDAMETGGTEAHLNAFVSFVKANGMDKYLRERDFESFARHYNGPNYYKSEYHIKLARIYQRILARNLPRHDSAVAAVLKSATLQRAGMAVATAAAPAAATLIESGNLGQIIDGVKGLAAQGQVVAAQVTELHQQAQAIAAQLGWVVWLPWIVGGWTVLLLLVFAAVAQRYLRDRGYLQ